MFSKSGTVASVIVLFTLHTNVLVLSDYMQSSGKLVCSTDRNWTALFVKCPAMECVNGYQPFPPVVGSDHPCCKYTLDEIEIPCCRENAFGPLRCGISVYGKREMNECEPKTCTLSKKCFFSHMKGRNKCCYARSIGQPMTCCEGDVQGEALCYPYPTASPPFVQCEDLGCQPGEFCIMRGPELEKCCQPRRSTREVCCIQNPKHEIKKGMENKVLIRPINKPRINTVKCPRYLIEPVCYSCSFDYNCPMGKICCTYQTKRCCSKANPFSVK